MEAIICDACGKVVAKETGGYGLITFDPFDIDRIREEGKSTLLPGVSLVRQHLCDDCYNKIRAMSIAYVKEDQNG